MKEYSNSTIGYVIDQRVGERDGEGVGVDVLEAVTLMNGFSPK